MDLGFQCGEEGLTCKFSTTTLKLVCKGEEWMKFEFEVVYLKLALLFLYNKMVITIRNLLDE